MEHLKSFLEHGKWKQLKKSDWIVLALAGVLLLIIAFPTGGGKGTDTKAAVSETNDTKTSAERAHQSETATAEGDGYAAELEKKLEAVLSQMDGVGEVKVMITLADTGESIVEKDSAVTAATTTETDSSGGSRIVSENSTDAKTVYVETKDETYPYVQKEKTPAIEGVVVVAQGGGNSKIVSDISEAVKALFPVEAHRIKVVKMCSKED